MRLAAATLFASTLLLSPSAHAGLTPPASDADASITFVSPGAEFIGAAFGMNAVDDDTLLLDGRSYTKFAGGLRTIHYACPGDVTSALGGYITYEFEAGKHYELVCGAGKQASVREAEGC